MCIHNLYMPFEETEKGAKKVMPEVGDFMRFLLCYTERAGVAVLSEGRTKGHSWCDSSGS